MKTNFRPGRLRRVSECAVARAAIALSLTLGLAPAQAFLTDDEARKAIVDLRNRVGAMDNDLRSRLTAIDDAAKQRHAEGMSVAASQSLARINALDQQIRSQLDTMLETFQRSLLELNTQLDVLRTEINSLRGSNEQLTRDLTEFQRIQREVAQTFDDRMRALEPVKVESDGREFGALPEERRQFDEAMRVLRGGEFDKALKALVAFQRRYPGSGYVDTARYWTANAHYVLRNHEAAIEGFRLFVKEAPQHPRTPEALLSLANSLAETKDRDGALKELERLIKEYPSSEAAGEGRRRQAALK